MLLARDLIIPLKLTCLEAADFNMYSIILETSSSLMGRKLCALLGLKRSSINQSVYHHVAKESRADVLWRKLETIYEQPTTQNKANLMKKLVNSKYNEGHSITERTSEFQGLVDQLTTMKIILDDELQALLLLSSLSDS
ncbi:hypothetical protein WN943_016353 [Citrus x changshan-huyou]